MKESAIKETIDMLYWWAFFALFEDYFIGSFRYECSLHHQVEEGICSESISCYTAELQCALNVTNPICDCDHLRSLVSDCRDFKESIPTNSLALALIGGIVYYIVVEALDYFAIRPFAYVKGAKVIETSELDQLMWERTPMRLDEDGNLIPFTHGDSAIPTRIASVVGVMISLALYVSFAGQIVNNSPSDMCSVHAFVLTPWLIIYVVFLLTNVVLLIFFAATLLDYYKIIPIEESGETLPLKEGSLQQLQEELPSPVPLFESSKEPLCFSTVEEKRITMKLQDPLFLIAAIVLLSCVVYSFYLVMSNAAIYGGVLIIPIASLLFLIAPFYLLYSLNPKVFDF